MKPAILLEEAANHIYDFGSQDASDILAKLNLKHGLAKLIWVLRKHKVDTENLFAVTSPDSGITRNKERWQAGFSYGCLLRWPSKEEAGSAFAFPEIRPNACGMLVAKLNEIPSLNELCERLHKIEKEGVEVESERLKLNVGISNHFIELCKVEESNSPELKPGDNVAVIHTSPSEFKSWLYDYKSWEAKGGTNEDTPFGPLLVLQGQLAEEYINAYQQIERFSYHKRLVLAKHLFKDFEVISNPTHQGLFGANEARLGLYSFENQDELLPLTFRWDIHVYLIKPEANITEELLDKEGLKHLPPAKKDFLKNLNMLPHGGGYEIPFSPEGWRVMQNGSKRLFANRTQANEFVFSSPSEIPYYYRGLQIIKDITRLRLGSVAAKLKQVYTLKY